MPKEKIGDLVSVEIRHLWSNEARDFTPWLAENAALLGDALGMNLRHEATEAPVGRYLADLLFVEEDNGHRVVVENLFRDTDHDHVGKLITYVAGLEAAYGVLLAPRFLDEHRSALNYLNNISKDEYGFFGVVLEAWRIGDSLPAPQLRVDVKPDNWSRSVKAQQNTRMSKSELAYQRFWGTFLPEFHDAHPGWSKATVPNKGNWMNFRSSRSSLLTYGAVFCRTVDGPALRVEVYIDNLNLTISKATFDQLHTRKDGIENTLGAELEWDRLDAKRAARVSKYFPSTISVSDEDRWPEARKWLISELGNFRQAFDPILHEIEEPDEIVEELSQGR